MSQSRNIIRGAGSSRALRRRIMRRGSGGVVKRPSQRLVRTMLRMREVMAKEGWS